MRLKGRPAKINGRVNLITRMLLFIKTTRMLLFIKTIRLPFISKHDA